MVYPNVLFPPNFSLKTVPFSVMRVYSSAKRYLGCGMPCCLVRQAQLQH